MDICDVCTCKDASFLCLCTYPFPRICNNCFSYHISKFSPSPHSLEPIAARQFLTSLKSVQEYRTRQSHVLAFRETIGESQCRVTECRTQIQEFAGKIREWLDEIERKLAEVELEVQNSVAYSLKSLEEVQYIPSYSPKSRLQKLLLEAASLPCETVSGELSSFVFNLECESALTTLRKCINFQLISSASARLPDQLPQSISKLPPESEDCNNLKQTIDALEAKLCEKNSAITTLQASVFGLKSALLAAQTELKALKSTANDCDRPEAVRNTLKRSKTITDPGTVKMQKTDTGSGEIHMGVKCDGCGVSPVVGPRWSCKDCGDFDYCDACYHTEVHAKLHKFVREVMT